MKKRILFEDASMYYNKWVSGIASRDLASQKIGFNEILKKNNAYDEQHPNLGKTENVLPFPIPNAVSVLGELITSTSNSITLFRISLRSPIVQRDKKARAEIITIINSLKESMNVLNKLIAKLQQPR